MTADSVRRENQRQKQLQSAIQNTRDFDTASGRIFKPLKSTCAANQTNGERGAANCGPVRNEGGEPRETSRIPSHVQRKQRQEEQRQANGCSNKDSRKNLALAQGLRLQRPCETSAIPNKQFAVECGTPSEQSNGWLHVTDHAHPSANGSKHEIKGGCVDDAGEGP